MESISLQTAKRHKPADAKSLENTLESPRGNPEVKIEIPENLQKDFTSEQVEKIAREAYNAQRRRELEEELKVEQRGVLSNGNPPQFPDPSKISLETVVAECARAGIDSSCVLEAVSTLYPTEQKIVQIADENKVRLPSYYLQRKFKQKFKQESKETIQNVLNMTAQVLSDNSNDRKVYWKNSRFKSLIEALKRKNFDYREYKFYMGDTPIARMGFKRSPLTYDTPEITILERTTFLKKTRELCEAAKNIPCMKPKIIIGFKI